MEVERSRAVRSAREHADEAVAAAERSQIIQQKAELDNAAIEASRIAEEGLSAAQRHLLATVDMIRAEGSSLVEKERKQIEKQKVTDGKITFFLHFLLFYNTSGCCDSHLHRPHHQSSRSLARNAELRREWAHQKEFQLGAVLQAEQAVQEQVLRMRH